MSFLWLRVLPARRWKRGCNVFGALGYCWGGHFSNYDAQLLNQIYLNEYFVQIVDLRTDFLISQLPDQVLDLKSNTAPLKHANVDSCLLTTNQA